MAIKVYHGFGHTHDMTIFGHVFRKTIPQPHHYSTNPIRNIFRLLRLFFVKPIPDVPVEVKWEEQLIGVNTASDGFFRAEWTAARETTAGWHPIEVRSANDPGIVGEGSMFIPHRTQYAFISDIDDTVMLSHSGTIWRRLGELLFRNPRSRQVFPGVARHYELLAGAHTTADAPNPFFYVSSSEWNLYDYLREVFDHNGLPNGAFLLNQVKRWYELYRTGKTSHEGKLLRILRLFELFPLQRFVLMGDNSQRDPAIYAKLAERYGDRILAVYIRQVNHSRETATRAILSTLEEKGIHTLLFRHSEEAIAHSASIGLI